MRIVRSLFETATHYIRRNGERRTYLSIGEPLTIAKGLELVGLLETTSQEAEQRLLRQITQDRTALSHEAHQFSEQQKAIKKTSNGEAVSSIYYYKETIAKDGLLDSVVPPYPDVPF
ncbi:MAG: hypothetical protein F6K17_33510 [Okeania sp. SIO3C4]|nr:hypothetical protein [Okeania sp. SIO3C4]